MGQRLLHTNSTGGFSAGKEQKTRYRRQRKGRRLHRGTVNERMSIESDYAQESLESGHWWSVRAICVSPETRTGSDAAQAIHPGNGYESNSFCRFFVKNYLTVGNTAP